MKVMKDRSGRNVINYVFFCSHIFHLDNDIFLTPNAIQPCGYFCFIFSFSLLSPTLESRFCFTCPHRRMWWWSEKKISPRRAIFKWMTRPATSWQRRWVHTASWANLWVLQPPSASNSPFLALSPAQLWSITSESTAWMTRRTRLR